ERLSFMVTDAGIRIVLTQEMFRPRLMECNAMLVCLDGAQELANMEPEPAGILADGVDGHNLAYVMYTSGSTGMPKGVEIEHHNIVHVVKNTNYIKFSSQDRIAEISTASFDAATFEIWGALLNGGCLAGISKETALNPVTL